MNNTIINWWEGETINQTNDGYYMSAVMDARDIEILELKRNNDLLIKELSDIKNKLETQQKDFFHFKGTLGQLEELKNSGLIP